MRDGYRIVDIDTHVIPAMELLHDYADDELRTRWGELTPYLRTNPPRPELGDYAHDSTSLSVAPYGFDRPLRGPQQDERAVAGGRGALLGRTTPVMTEAPEPAIQHDNSEGRLRSMDREGVDVNLIIAIGLPMVPKVARVVRSSALAIRELPYIDAARTAGFSDTRIIFRH